MTTEELKSIPVVDMADEIIKQRVIKKNKEHERKFFHNTMRLGNELVKVKTQVLEK
jgi:hypothetical protein